MSINEDASPICRGKNLSWETVMLFFNNMPKISMPKDKFNTYVESNINGWTQTHSQIARQLAFYYEEDGVCYPRFDDSATLIDLFNYMIHWAHNYFIPNPYTPSLKGKTQTSIYFHLINCIYNNILEFDTALDSLFDISLSSHDKVKVYLQNYTNIKFDKGFISINKNIIDNIEILTPTEEAANDPKTYFMYFNIDDSEVDHNKSTIKKIVDFPLQQIFYGAPGTGKSHKIKEQTKGQSVIRTTFHPDSDYSTFVGAYKPTTKSVELRDVSGHKIIEDGKEVKEDRIVYEFVAQAFLQAYVQAWKYYVKPMEDGSIKPQFLVIEEINRGNCAQIFGDLFQLLDRNKHGYSCYPIIADKDVKNFLVKEFNDISISSDIITEFDEYEGDIAADIKSGKVLVLPNNLYIWATMNTSDQSLFPIDSAFKRRWDWKYIPIDTNKENWTIKTAKKEYSWSSFLQKINDEIDDTTHSEDKMLGFYFCKADDNLVDADKFVNKVLFYIYNDVFKDYGFDRDMFKGEDGKPMSFHSYYNLDGSINENLVEKFLDNLIKEENSTIPSEENVEQ